MFCLFQGQVVPDLGLAGVFIEALDYDDYVDNCHCGCFAATQAIGDAVQQRGKNLNLTQCYSFGKTIGERFQQP